MTRWGGALGRRRGGGRSSGSSAPAGREQAEQSPRQEGAGAAVLVEDYEGLFLVRSPSDRTLSSADVADLARVHRSDDGTVTVIAGAESVAAEAFWPRLSELLDSFLDSGTETVRLVMSHAGHDRGDRPATARRIADAWGLEVNAPDGPPLVVPGGSLFVPVSEGPGADGGWWRFAPGREPEPLGPRSPAPPWQSALRGVPAATNRGCVVEQIPAGLLVRPGGSAATRPGDLYHSVPVDPQRLAVVVGVPYGEDVSAEEIADVLSALPEAARSAVRLAPGGRRDVLRLAQSVSDLLDTELELTTGLPLLADDGALGTYSARSVLIGSDGTPQWLPFVDAVVCRPAKGGDHHPPSPRLLRWATPLQGATGVEEGVIGLSEEWQVTVTRAGLWVGAQGGRLPDSAREVSAAGPVIEVGAPGEPLDPTLWPALSGMLGALAADLRERATLQVHGVPLDDGHELRRLAADHGLRTIRFTPRPASRAGAGASEVTAGRIPARGSATPVNPASAEGPKRSPDPGQGAAAAASHSVGQGRVGDSGQSGASAAASAGGSVSPVEAGQDAQSETPSEPTVDTGRGDDRERRESREPMARASRPVSEEPARPPTVPSVSSRPSTVSSGSDDASASGSDRSSVSGAERSSVSGADRSSASGPERSVESGLDRSVESGSDDASASGPERSSVSGSERSSASGAARSVESGSDDASASGPDRSSASGPDRPAASDPDRSSDSGPARSVESGPASEPVSGSDVPESALPPVPFEPGHRSTEAERSAFRALADAHWERHGAAVARSLARMPALRGKEQEAARADLIALRLYLHSTEGPLNQKAVTPALRSHDARMLPYAACLASALSRLPSYRGVVLRGTGADAGRAIAVPRPGALLRDPAPVSATPLDPTRPAMTAGNSYVIWSVAARRVRQVLDAGDGPEEVVFAPGTLFRVLDVRGSDRGDSSVQIFLRELTGPHRPHADPVADRAALERLDEAVSGRSAPAAADQWPERCTGPFGAGP